MAQRSGATEIDEEWQVWRAIFGQTTKAPRSLLRQKRTSTSSPRSQVTAMLSAVRLALAAMKSLSIFFRRSRNLLVRRFQHVGNGELVAGIFHRREVILRAEPGAEAVFDIFVTREALAGIDATRLRHRRAGKVRRIAAVLGIGTIQIFRPEAVDDEPLAGSGGALVARLLFTSGIAKPGRPGQRQHVEIKVARGKRGSRARRPAPLLDTPPMRRPA